MAKKTITVEGKEITLFPIKEAEDYISISDIMRSFEDEFAVYSWMRNKNTVEFLGVWEQLHNPNFNSNEFVRIKNEAGANSFNLTPKKWIEATGAIGMTSKTGRYGSGIFAHKDIVVNFCYWLSPTFQLYLIKEFQRLKEIEAKEHRESLDWNLKRTLAKVNYRVHTDAIKTYLIPPKFTEKNIEGLYYASEADILNLALFGVTAKQWREENAELKGNIRDHASTEQLLILSNLENLNAEFIKLGMNKQDRLKRLNETAIHQIGLFLDNHVLKQLKSSGDTPNK